MSRRCLACGGKKGNHDRGCERLAVMLGERERLHPTTPEELAARSLSRAKRRGRGKPAHVNRNTAAMRRSRERRGWQLDATGEFVPSLPEPIGRLPDGAAIRLRGGSMGSRVLLAHACPWSGNAHCWEPYCATAAARCYAIGSGATVRRTRLT